MVQQSPRRLELTVTADQAGEKIDTLLRRELRLSGTVIRRVKWLDDGILLDGMRVTTACRPADVWLPVACCWTPSASAAAFWKVWTGPWKLCRFRRPRPASWREICTWRP